MGGGGLVNAYKAPYRAPLELYYDNFNDLLRALSHLGKDSMLATSLWRCVISWTSVGACDVGSCWKSIASTPQFILAFQPPCSPGGPSDARFPKFESHRLPTETYLISDEEGLRVANIPKIQPPARYIGLMVATIKCETCWRLLS
jgi:hypothetical protein